MLVLPTEERIPLSVEGTSWNCLNPSILRLQDEYLVLVRTVNYKLEKGCFIFSPGDSRFRTQNYLLRLTSDWKLIKSYSIEDDLNHRRVESSAEGLEDCRLFFWPSKELERVLEVWFSCTTPNISTPDFNLSICRINSEQSSLKLSKSCLGMGTLKIDTLICLESPTRSRLEKNWLPFIHEGTLHFIYSIDPWIVLLPDPSSGKSIILRKESSRFPNYRGGAPPIEFYSHRIKTRRENESENESVKYDLGYLFVGHRRYYQDKNTPIYVHRFFWMDTSFQLRKVSEEFFFEQPQVEFCSGLESTFGSKIDRDLLLGVGIRDESASIYQVSFKTVESLLQVIDSSSPTNHQVLNNRPPFDSLFTFLGLDDKITQQIDVNSSTPTSKCELTSLANTTPLIPSDQQITLVTGFFDLGSRENNPKRRQAQDYLRYGEFVLSLDLPMVIFVDPPFASFVRDKRSAFPEKTKIVEITLEEMPYYQHLDNITEYRKNHPIRNASPTKDTPLYMVAIWSKFTMLSRVLEENPFESTHFGWIDFAVAHNTGNRHFAEDQVFTKFDDKIRLLLMAQFDRKLITNDLEGYLKLIWGNISANYMTANHENMKFFCQKFDQLVTEMLRKGYGPSEEMMFPILCTQYPDRFTYFYGNYDGAILNYRRPRGSIQTILLHLSRCRNFEDHSMVCVAGKECFESINEGILEATPYQVLTILDEYYIGAFYQNAQNRKLPLTIAKKCVDLIKSSPEYQEAFHKKEEHLRKNFSFLPEDVFKDL